MDRKTSYSIHGALTLLQSINLTTLAGRIQLIVGVGIAVMQAVAAAKVHWSNPDGSPAAFPYSKDDN